MNFKQVLFNLLSRKMVMFFVTQIIVFFLTLWGKVTGDNFLLVEGWVITAFVMGNAAEYKYKSATVETEIKATGDYKGNPLDINTMPIAPAGTKPTL